MAAHQPTDRLWQAVEAIQRAVPAEWRGAERGTLRDAPTKPVSAFVTWAHRDPHWSDDDARAWQEQVAKFAVTLRTSGIDADVDLFHLEDTATDWTRFGPQRIDGCDFVLIVMSRAWADRWEGRNDPRVGAGAVGEADELHGLFQRDQSEWQRKCLVALFPEVDASIVPSGLARLNRFSLDPYDLSTYEPLLRTVTSQPQYAMPDLGPVPSFPERGPHAASLEGWLAKARAEKRGRRDGGPASDETAIGREALTQAVIDTLRES